MRKIITIFFLFVLTVLQYGKIVSYLYCELKTELSTETASSCDCEKIISDNSRPAIPYFPHDHKVKLKLQDPYTAFPDDEILILACVNTSCSFSISPVQKGFLNPRYHPPSG